MRNFDIYNQQKHPTSKEINNTPQVLCGSEVRVFFTTIYIYNTVADSKTVHFTTVGM